MRGFLRRAGAHLGRVLVSFGLGGVSGAAPVVDAAGCGHMTITPTATGAMTVDPTATGVFRVDPTAEATLTFESC